MAKKPKNTKKSRFGNPAKAAAENTVVSFADAVAKRALEPLMPGFHQWMGQAGVEPEEVQWLSSLLTDFFKNYAQNIPAPDVRNLDVDLTSMILDSAGSFHPEMRQSVSLALNSYLKFLMTTQAWSGTPNNLAYLIAMTTPEAVQAANAKFAARVISPPMPHSESEAAAAKLVFVRRAKALLDWIGDGRELTTSGLLKRKDIQGAAACVGIAAVGAASRSAPQEAPGAPMPVTSMTQLGRLMNYWNALVDAEFINVSTSRVALTGGGRGYLAATDRSVPFATLLSYFLLYDVLVPWNEYKPDDQVRNALAEILTSAASAHPPESSAVFSDKTPENPRDFIGIMVESAIQRLAEDGLVDVGSHIVIPPVLRHAVEQLLRILDDRIEEHLAGAPEPSSATYRLRIQINGITPPVWRSVDVPAEMGLHDLHDTIQRLFAWNDSHLHEFMLGTHPTGVRYAPDDPEADHWGEPPLNEKRVPLNTLLTEHRDSLLYSYDFGDNWEHAITLESILPAAAPGTLPQCVGGSGHAPQEDSFGPHGWMEKIATSQNPSDPDHQDIRRWLGLRKGQNIDPVAFDQARVNTRLKALRTVQ